MNNYGELNCTIDIRVQPKQRARTTKKGITYTPKETIVSEMFIKGFVQGRMWKDGLERIEKPAGVSVSITIFRKPPKSFPKKKLADALAGKIVPIRKPDMDNQEKTILDALNGIAYADDAQVVDKRTRKLYGEIDQVHIVITRSFWDGV